MTQKHTPYDEPLEPFNAKALLPGVRIVVEHQRIGYLAALNDPENKRKLEAFDELLKAATEAESWLESSLTAFNRLTAWENVSQARNILRAAIAKASPQTR